LGFIACGGYICNQIYLALLVLVGVFILGCLLSLLISHLIGLLFLGPASAACYAFLLLESINVNQVISAIYFMLGAAALCRFNLYPFILVYLSWFNVHYLIK
jgi:hypothetical protein